MKSPGIDQYQVRNAAGRTVTTVILLAAAVATVFPLVYAFFAAFKPRGEILANGSQLFPDEWTLDNFVNVWELGGFERYFINSILVAAGVVALDFLISSFLGYMLARRMLTYHRVLTGAMAATLFISVGTATLYPRFVIAQAMGIDNLVGIVVVELSGLCVIHSFLIRAFVSTLPIELEDAARLDGSGLFGIYWRIALPLMRPILITTVILAFQAAWNNFQIPLVFTFANPELRTLVVGVYALRSSGDSSEAYDLMLAGAMLIIVPIVIVFLLLQRYFIRGMIEGGVRG